MVVSKPPFSVKNLFEASVPHGIEKVTGLISSLFSLQNRAIETLVFKFCEHRESCALLLTNNLQRR